MANDKLLDKYSENLDDLKQYAEAQYKTIIAQSQKIAKLEEDNEKLTAKLAELSNDLAGAKALNAVQEQTQFDTDDVETTCVLQLSRLKQVAVMRDLTLEETKKFESFSRVLREHKGKQPRKSEEFDINTLSAEDLARMMTEDIEQ